MIRIEYPEWQPKIKSEQQKEYIFDSFRKGWFLLTPEEWVRQNFLQYMVLVKKYPASLIAVEREIKLGELQKRFDIVLFKDAQPWMMVECKEPNVKLDHKTLDQVLRYNISLQVPNMIITNGEYCYGFTVKENNLQELNELPVM